ncbi:MAG: DJ-1/PfpI family protein [Acidobacteria bacterium]|nr:DJ-1/PfpI family protein [Acidobacteriota bacterium]
MKRVLVLLAPGFEEIEAVTVIDLLRRAKIQVVTAGTQGVQVTGSHQITLVAETTLAQLGDQSFDMLVLPGGMPGAKNLQLDDRVIQWVRTMHDQFHWIGAICAAPMVLGKAGVLEGLRATSYPGFLEAFPEVRKVKDPVVVDQSIITARGPGVAIDFALRLIEVLCGRSKHDQIEASLQRDASIAVREE